MTLVNGGASIASQAGWRERSGDHGHVHRIAGGMMYLSAEAKTDRFVDGDTRMWMINLVV